MLKKYVLVLLFIIFIGMYTGLSPYKQNIHFSKINSNIVNGANPYTTSTDKINPDNPDIQKYFQKVAKVPYKANYDTNAPKKPAQFWKDNYGDCDDKSAAFADYLNRMGAEDIKIVIILHNSKKYSHCVVIWKNHVFDPTVEPPLYNMEQTKYFNYLKKMGFNLQITYPYTYYKKSYL